MTSLQSMILVSVAFVICWLPMNIFFIIVDNTAQQSLVNIFPGFYATVFLAYLYICMNPFIYAIKHEGVREKLAGLIVWRRRAKVTTSDRETPETGNRRIDVVGGGTPSPQAGITTRL